VTRPVEIVGGGLAGLALGLALRRHGVPTTVYEAGHYPRHRVCGEFIAGLGERTIDRLGLAPFLADAVPHREVTWFRGPQAGQRQTLPRSALGLSRYVLDARLAEAFAAAGGTLQTDTRHPDPRPAAGRVLAAGRRAARSPWIGLKVHLALPPGNASPLARGLEVHLGRRAYVGLSAVEGGRYNLCGFFHRQAAAGRSSDAASLGALPRERDRRFHFALLDHLAAAGLDELAARIAPHLDPTSFTAVAGLQVNPAVRREAGLAIGDACAMIPPFTGNGMAMAFQSAESALGPLLAYARHETSWSHAVAAVRSALRRRFSLRLASASILHPFLLQPGAQRWLAAAARAGVLPLQPLYALLH
jgi:flavin-dependent dehydrogenase